MTLLNLSWYYNWTASTNCTSSAQFIPQFWGHAGENYAAELTTATSRGYTTILGFNEPDNATQANILVPAAIGFWPQLTSNPAVRVGSPATQGNTLGLTWLQNFMTQVNADTTGRLRVDFISFHWYGWNAGSCDPAAATLEAYLKQIEAIPGNLPLWLTEWGCLNLSAPTAPTVAAFYSGAIAMFAKHPRLERYGWFTSRTGDNNGLVTSAGVLTPLGAEYAAAPASR